MNLKMFILIGVVAYLLITIAFLARYYVILGRQQILSFSQNQSVIGYNITAVAQSDTNGNGPAYLVNGLSNTGYWYQIGLSYNWTYAYGNVKGFQAIFDIFNPYGSIIYPSGGGGGVLNMTGKINPGDKVLLEMYFNHNGTISMLLRDWNTNASAYLSYYAFNATTFIGTGNNATGAFFTGLMTEWDHFYPYNVNEKATLYTPFKIKVSPAWLITDEQVYIGKRGILPIFESNTVTPVSTYQGYTLRVRNSTDSYLKNGSFLTN